MIFPKIDDWLIGKMDDIGIWLQRRGWSLLIVKLAYYVVCMGAVVSASYVTDELPWAIILLFILSLELWGRWRQLQSYGDYFEVVDKMRHLNARVLVRRCLRWSRGVSVYVGAFWLIIAALETRLLLLAVSWCVFFLLSWLDCASFIGPGEFGRKKQERTDVVWQGST